MDGVPNIVGTKTVATVSSHTKVEEMPMLCFTTPTEHSMLDSGKSINQTGAHAVEDMPHAIFNQTLTVPSKFINGEETLSNSGAHTLLVDVDLKSNYFQVYFQVYYWSKMN